MITVLTWFWQQPGGRAQYTARHVNIWAAMVRRHLAMPHRIACVTDHPEGIDPSIDIIAPPRDFEDWRIPTWGPDKPQCLRRIAMFGPDAGRLFGDRFVCMDLDLVVSGPLDPLFTDHDFRIYEGTGPGRFYNGSMMMIRAGARPQVYERFTVEGAIEAGRQHVGSDQAWIAHCLGPREATWGAEDGVHWWARHGRQQTGADTRVMFFPGSTKPWATEHPYIRLHYRGDDPRRCLILGYAPTVWEETESALKRQNFDAVIASPEAAVHWPGEVYAVVHSDDEADRLAAMVGFREVVFCGRSGRVAA